MALDSRALIRSSAKRFVFIASACIIYFVGVVVLSNTIGEAAMKLSVLPIIGAAGVFGLRGGVIAGLILIPANYLFFAHHVGSSFEMQSQYQFWSAQALLLIVGGYAGSFGEARAKLRKEVSQRERIENRYLATVKQLQSFRGTMPICSACKQIRETSGEWVEVESFIQERSGASFTHGICPPCADSLYPE